MGIFKSKEVVPPPLLEVSWRESNDWSEEHLIQLQRDVITFEPSGSAKCLNILFIGQVKSGKSSFINSCVTGVNYDQTRNIHSILTVHNRALGRSVTTKFQQLTTFGPNHQSLFSKLRLFDCPGIIEEGITAIDLKYILKGNIKSGYKVKDKTPIDRTDGYFRADPTINDKIHCIVYVVDGSVARDGLLQEHTLQILDEIRREAEETDIGRIVLMTHADRIRASLQEDISNIYHSKEIQDMVKCISEYTGFPLMDIFPISNYCTETQVDIKKTILILSTLLGILNKANDFVLKEDGFAQMTNDEDK